MRRFLAPVAALVVSVVAVGCLQQVEGTGRTQLLLTNAEQENQLGAEAYKDVLQKEPRANDPEGQAMIERVGRRLAAVAPDRGFQWEFNLIESKDMNAFCLPGGKVAFYTGLLPLCQNEAAVATVMGHEIGHAIARHGGERMTQASIAQNAQGALSAWLDSKQTSPAVNSIAQMAFGAGAQVGVLLPFSRKHESEADELGLQYLAAAGYDPEEAVKFWQRFAQATGGGGKEGGIGAYLSTHPQSGDRAKALQKELAKAKQLYAQAKEKHGIGALVPAKYRK
jgi:metalloendopeptidase OMA1, mitochondrial